MTENIKRKIAALLEKRVENGATKEEAEAARATDEVKCEPSSYSCRACKSGTDEEIERLKTENARLREALAFYAELDGRGIQLYGYMDSKALEFDDGESFPFGKKARDALKGAENDT